MSRIQNGAGEIIPAPQAALFMVELRKHFSALLDKCIARPTRFRPFRGQNNPLYPLGNSGNVRELRYVYPVDTTAEIADCDTAYHERTFHPHEAPAVRASLFVSQAPREPRLVIGGLCFLRSGPLFLHGELSLPLLHDIG